jgi:hypothetical protein
VSVRSSFRRAALIAATILLPAALQAQTVQPTAFNGLRWREIGPARGGRSVAVAGSVQRPNEYWMGTTGGGVFKTTDGGQNWQPASDRYFGGTIGAIGRRSESEPRHRVGGRRRDRHPRQHLAWRRALEDDRRRPHLDDARLQGERAHLARPHPSHQPRHRLRRRVRPTLQGNDPRGVYKTVDGGKSFNKVLFRQRLDRGVDLHHGSRPIPTCCTRPPGRRTGGRGRCQLGRDGRRHHEVHRRWRDLDASSRRRPRGSRPGRARQDRVRRLAREAAPAVGADRA